jgi:coenzyme F420 hydrogenase subunit beta
VREPDEMSGIWRQLLLTRAADDEEHQKGQDGGFVSAMLNWLLDNDYIDAALVSGSRRTMRGRPSRCRHQP